MRASEAEREAAVEELRRHASVGRLDVDELEQRVEAAFAARTLDDLSGSDAATCQYRPQATSAST